MLKTYREANLTPKHQGFVYQVEAFEAVKDLPFSAVFHEQGLGKTKIGVDLVLYWLTQRHHRFHHHRHQKGPHTELAR